MTAGRITASIALTVAGQQATGCDSQYGVVPGKR